MPTIKPLNHMKAKGWLTSSERQALYNSARFTPVDGTIINIGVEHGASLICFVAGRRNDSIRVVGIDIDPEPWNNMGYPPFPNLDLRLSDSGTLAEGWGDPVSTLFIDGDHSYDGVMRDTAWIDHVLPGGTIIFHDCYEWDAPPRTVRAICPDVNRAVDDWFAENEDGFYELQPVDSMRIFRKKR